MFEVNFPGEDRATGNTISPLNNTTGVSQYAAARSLPGKEKDNARPIVFTVP